MTTIIVLLLLAIFVPGVYVLAFNLALWAFFRVINVVEWIFAIAIILVAVMVMPFVSVFRRVFK